MTKDQDDRSAGLPRALNEGDSVILSTGATATVRRSYPAGYDGDVEILLDGAKESDRADALTLPDTQLPLEDPALGDVSVARNDVGETRGPSRRMED
jgi:hypothetical protein